MMKMGNAYALMPLWNGGR